jgi:hypothetical protein
LYGQKAHPMLFFKPFHECYPLIGILPDSPIESAHHMNAKINVLPEHAIRRRPIFVERMHVRIESFEDRKVPVPLCATEEENMVLINFSYSPTTFVEWFKRRGEGLV